MRHFVHVYYVLLWEYGISRFRLRSVRVTVTLDQSIGDFARSSHEITALPLPPRARMGLG